MSRGHKKLEKNIGLMGVFIVIAVSLGGLVEILPLIFQDQVATLFMDKKHILVMALDLFLKVQPNKIKL